MTPRSRPLPAWGPPALALAAATITAAAYWPGLMTWDSVNQYGQALAGRYDDWHPPAMAWLWRRLAGLHAGPAPMLLLQLALWWGGMLLWASAARRRGRAGLALAGIAVGAMPLALALLGAVIKDSLMAGALAVAAGCVALVPVSARPRPLRAAGAAALLFAATLRFNAFLAAAPLLVALLPPAWRGGRVRAAAAALGAVALLLVPLPLANRLIGAHPSGVGLSLEIFDLGGITERSRQNLFPPLGLADAVRANDDCYRAVRWDGYSDWVDPECPLGYTAVRAAGFEPGMRRRWLLAIATHPLAYAGHRLAHFNLNTRFLVRGRVERPVQRASAPNPWGYAVRQGPLLTWVDRLARWQAASPLGWPAAWLALAAAVLLIAPALPGAPPAAPLAWSGLLYGLGYLPFSVAAELRYHLWTITATALAALATTDDLAAGARPYPGRSAAAAAVLAAVLVPAAAWRLLPLA